LNQALGNPVTEINTSSVPAGKKISLATSSPSATHCWKLTEFKSSSGAGGRLFPQAIPPHKNKKATEIKMPFFGIGERQIGECHGTYLLSDETHGYYKKK
jgi:hypothetical protein